MQRLSYRGCGVGSEQSEQAEGLYLVVVVVVKAAATGVH
jgi:hypothetical protein